MRDNGPYDALKRRPAGRFCNGRPGLPSGSGSEYDPELGLALEVGDLVGLVVGALLMAGHLILGLALALLPPTLAAQRRIARQVACSLLGLTCDLVQKAHICLALLDFDVSVRLPGRWP